MTRGPGDPDTVLLCHKVFRLAVELTGPETGLPGNVLSEGAPYKVRLDREYNAEITVTIPANGYTWLVIK